MIVIFAIALAKTGGSNNKCEEECSISPTRASTHPTITTTPMTEEDPFAQTPKSNPPGD